MSSGTDQHEVVVDDDVTSFSAPDVVEINKRYVVVDVAAAVVRCRLFYWQTGSAVHSAPVCDLNTRDDSRTELYDDDVVVVVVGAGRG